MFVDSHCHLNYDDYKEDLDAVIQRAKDVDITTMVSICTEMAEAQAILDLANKHEELFCTVGVHPHEAKEAGSDLQAQLKQFTKFDKVIGLGETGLDYYYEHSPQQEQKQAFQTHIDVAEETGLPLIIHTRDAEQDTVDMLVEKQGKVTGVFHCFSGSAWLAEKALEMGFYISISGIVTFKKADDLRDIVKSVPLDKLLVETDAPYLAPVPKRGKRNEPAFMIYTAEVVAELKGVSMKGLGQATTDNFKTLFAKAS